MLSTILDARARSRVEKKDLAVCMYVYVDICIQKIARVSARIYFSFSFSLFFAFYFLLLWLFVYSVYHRVFTIYFCVWNTCV